MKKFILITGGELFNKGAQAMTFVTIDEMAKRFPDAECVVISGRDAKRSESEKSVYRFKFIKNVELVQGFLLTLPLVNRVFADKLYHDYYKNAILQIDISGYRLGSNWGIGNCISYIMNIMIAKKYRIPVYLMPQSFGPFSFDGIKGFITDKLIKHTLKYPKIIMARESSGQKQLCEKYALQNVIKTNDLVLENKKIDLRNIFNETPDFFSPKIAARSVAIIPNMKNSKYGNEDSVLASYNLIIQALLEENRTIYLIYHALEDKKICETIKKEYPDDERVIIIERELSCIEYSIIVKEFDYIVASRFHSIVHAYKECVPAIIIGWAEKYKNLAALFGQSNYQCDVRNGLNPQTLLQLVSEMDDVYKVESYRIRKALEIVQKDNVFNHIVL